MSGPHGPPFSRFLGPYFWTEIGGDFIFRKLSTSSFVADAEDFEPPQAQPAKLTDKWEGEDEDDSVKVRERPR